MRIERAEVIPYALGFREPYVTARGVLERRELILFRLTTDGGVVGLGETTSLSLRGGRPLAEIAAELELVGHSMLAVGPGQGFSAMLADLEERAWLPETRNAYVLALTDIVARTRGEQAWWHGRQAVPCNATLSAGVPADVASEAERWAAAGFATFKLKMGREDDVEQVEAVRTALGGAARIRVDANGAWDAATAKEKLAELEPLDLELCEQPVRTLEEMAEVRGSTTIPIAADESVATQADAERAAELGACDLVTFKLAKVGGPHEALAGSRHDGSRRSWPFPVFMSSALDGAVGISAAGGVAQAMRIRDWDAGLAHGLATQLLFTDTIAKRGPELRDGMLHPPDGPGLGIEIDEKALARHRI